MTTVVNIQNTKKYDVYIGRPSIFGNPFIIGKDGNCDEVIKKYEKYFNEKMKKDIIFKEKK